MIAVWLIFDIAPCYLRHKKMSCRILLSKVKTNLIILIILFVIYIYIPPVLKQNPSEKGERLAFSTKNTLLRRVVTNHLYGFYVQYGTKKSVWIKSREKRTSKQVFHSKKWQVSSNISSLE